MKLVFYSKYNLGKNAGLHRVERDATPNINDGKVVGYSFDTIEDCGRPFSYIRLEGIGRVVNGDYHTMLVLSINDDVKAKSLWQEYFNSEIHKEEEKMSRLKDEMKAITNSPLLA